MYPVDSPRFEQRKDYLKLSEELSLKFKLSGEDLLSLIFSDSLSAPLGVSDDVLYCGRFERGRVNASHAVTGAFRLGIRLHRPQRMTCEVNEPAIFNNGLSPERMREREVIVFGIRLVNRLAADAAPPLGTLVNYLLVYFVEQPLRVKPNANLLDNLGPPFVIVFRDGRPGSRLSDRSSVPIHQNVGGKLLHERFVEFEQAVA